MSSRAYTTFSCKARRLFKASCKNTGVERTEKNFCLFGHYVMAAAIQAENAWEEDVTYVELACEFLWSFRRIQHYFLAPGVADFCVSCVKEISDDYCKRLPACDPVDVPCSHRVHPFTADMNFMGVGGDERKMRGGFAVHFPANERRHSMMVIPDTVIPATPVDPVTGKRVVAGRHYRFVALDGEDVLLIPDHIVPGAHVGEGADESTFRLEKFILGLSLYMDAFPDAVVPSKDGEIHQVNHYTGEKHIVSANEIINEEHRNGTDPHWRRGHMRLLSAARFVHKQGQTVWVRGTFVKGRAFDVLDDAQPQGAS